MEDLNKSTPRPQRGKEVAFSTLVDKDSGREVASLWREDLLDLIVDKDRHDKLVAVCNGALTEDDRVEPAFHDKVYRAFDRLTSERDSLALCLKRLCEARAEQADTGESIPPDLWASARNVLQVLSTP